MAALAERLREDHANARRLLRVLERHLNRAAAGGKPDYQLMTDLMHYMMHYADMFHHPLEDRLFRAVAAKNDDLKDECEALVGQHRDLAAAGNALMDELEAVVHESLIPWTEIDQRARQYIEMLRAHMGREESHVFGPVERMLEAAPAETFETPDLEQDPLFGDSVKSRYRDLYQAILSDDAALSAEGS